MLCLFVCRYYCRSMQTMPLAFELSRSPTSKSLRSRNISWLAKSYQSKSQKVKASHCLPLKFHFSLPFGVWYCLCSGQAYLNGWFLFISFITHQVVSIRARNKENSKINQPQSPNLMSIIIFI